MCPPQVKFCDYHRMMETDEEEDDVFGKEEDPAPLCDFGVYVEEVAIAKEFKEIRYNPLSNPQMPSH